VKAIILLAIALFLAAAPEPDSHAISEITARFIVLDQPDHLQAAETTPATGAETTRVGAQAARRLSKPTGLQPLVLSTTTSSEQAEH
jgi:hypothetical protein